MRVIVRLDGVVRVVGRYSKRRTQRTKLGEACCFARGSMIRFCGGLDPRMAVWTTLTGCDGRQLQESSSFFPADAVGDRSNETQ